MRFDVTKAGFRVRRLDTEGDQPAFGSKGHGFGDGSGKCLFVLNQMVCSQHQHLGVRAMRSFQLKCSSSHGSSGITTEWFEDKPLSMLRCIDCAVLVFSLEQEFTVGHRKNLHNAFQARSTQEGFLDQILPIWQLHERLWMGLSRNGPQPATHSTRQNYGNQFHALNP